jgi:hypothetical protein
MSIKMVCFFQIRVSHVSRFIYICDLFTDSSSYNTYVVPSYPSKYDALCNISKLRHALCRQPYGITGLTKYV